MMCCVEMVYTPGRMVANTCGKSGGTLWYYYFNTGIAPGFFLFLMRQTIIVMSRLY